MKPSFLILKLTFMEIFRQKWVIASSLLFAGLVLLLSVSGSGSMSGVTGFDRLTALLLNILLLYIPLLGLTIGAQIIAGDRESGALYYLLSHPVSRLDYFLGKLYGANLVIYVSLSLSFGLAGLSIAFYGSSGVGNYIILCFFSFLFSFLCVSIGLLISVLSRNRTKALGFAVMFWLVFTIFSDLGIMGASLLLKLSSKTIVGLTLLNPIETFKVLLIKLSAKNLEVLGTSGMFFDSVFGKWMVPILLSWLIFIIILTISSALLIFLRQEEN